MDCYSLFSGSGGNCLFVREGDSRLLVDAGVSFRRICLSLAALGEDLFSFEGVFFTHEHSDHVGALSQLLKKTALPFFLEERCAEGAYESLLAKDPSLAAEFVHRVRTVCAGKEYEIGRLCLTPFSLPHDSAACLGVLFCDENSEKLLGVATDLGEMTAESRGALYGARAVVLECNHDLAMLENGPYPPYLKERIRSAFGHLSNDDCAAFLTLLAAGGLERALLFHLSEENNTPALALRTCREALESIGASPALSVAAAQSTVALLRRSEAS